jgi:hypothetical protein
MMNYFLLKIWVKLNWNLANVTSVTKWIDNICTKGQRTKKHKKFVYIHLLFSKFSRFLKLITFTYFIKRLFNIEIGKKRILFMKTNYTCHIKCLNGKGNVLNHIRVGFLELTSICVFIIIYPISIWNANYGLASWRYI